MQFMDTEAYLVGKRKRGLTQYVMSLMNGARLGIAGQSVGIAQAAYLAALDYSNAREQFGKKIKDIPPVGDMLAEMVIQIEAARALNMETCKAVDIERFLEEAMNSGEIQDRDELKAIKARQTSFKRCAAMLTPMAKLYGSEMCQEVTTNAIQVLGGSGYMRDYPLERHFRDARITNVYEGTTQLQVVAAILGVTSGTWTGFIEDLDKRVSETTEKDLLDLLRQESKEIEKTIIDFNGKEENFRELYARDLVEAAIELINGYLLLECGNSWERKKLIARRYITRAIPRIRSRRERIEIGERTTLDRLPEILQEV